jgi:hypothetical protein
LQEALEDLPRRQPQKTYKPIVTICSKEQQRGVNGTSQLARLEHSLPQSCIQLAAEM